MTAENLPEIQEQTIIIRQQTISNNGEITVQNDSPYDVNVFVVNGTLGPYACGYIKSNNELKLPTGMATAVDVFILFELNAHLFIEWSGYFELKCTYHKVKNWVSPGSTVRISEM